MNNFRDMHVPGKPFVLANAWDVGSAKLLEARGAKAIATSSAAHAFTLGRLDGGNVTRDEALAHAQDLIGAVNVPVSGDFEDGYGMDPDICAETVRLAGEVGLAGICIEDVKGGWDTAYDFDLAVERMKAAASAARALPKDFFFVARADGIMIDAYDIEEALRRVRAFDEAGADGLYVPMPKTLGDMGRIISATSKPVNVLAAGPYAKITLGEFAKMGAARVSLGSSLARATLKTLDDTAQAMLNDGDFTGLSDTISFEAMDNALGGRNI